MPAVLAPFLPWILAAAGTALAALAIRGVSALVAHEKTLSTDAADQSKLDDLEHLLDTSVNSVVPMALEDLVAGNTSKLIYDAETTFRQLASSEFLDDMAVVVRIEAGEIDSYIRARLAGKVAAHPAVAAAYHKVLSLSAGQSAAVNAMSPAEKRNMVATQGTPSPL